MKTGVGFGVTAKYFLGKKRNFGITFSVGYRMFTSSADSVTFLGPVAEPALSGGPAARDFRSKLNAITLSAGAEYDLLTGKNINFFIDAELTGHFFEGKYEYTQEVTTYRSNLEPAARFGIAGGVGADIALGSRIGIFFGTRYQIANHFGKNSEKPIVPGYPYRLNDKEYSFNIGNLSYKYGSKNITYVDFYGGISFYFNQLKKKK